MRILIFLAGFAAGWLALSFSIRRLGLVPTQPDVTGTISGPDGDWKIEGLRMSRLPVQP